jgi:ParB-like chromosome segregation protein Spo0J
VLVLKESLLRAALVESVAVDDLMTAFAPRRGGTDETYARELAETAGDLPPILVHRPTLRVIDGTHRLRAARLRGQDRVQARFFDGDDEDCYLLAVAMNVTHGRRLSMEERSSAAEHILRSHPEWSDRSVAEIAGLSARKVAELRGRPSRDGAAGSHRVGRDGRCRPVDFARGRQLAGELLRSDPDASLRGIAREIGISPATVADVRDRIRRGEDPVPGRGRQPTARTVREARPSRPQPEPAAILDALRRDPSLRLTEAGRTMLRMLDVCAAFTRDRGSIASRLPAHCRQPMSVLVQNYARAWQQLAIELADEELAVRESVRPVQPGSGRRPVRSDPPVREAVPRVPAGR